MQVRRMVEGRGGRGGAGVRAGVGSAVSAVASVLTRRVLSLFSTRPKAAGGAGGRGGGGGSSIGLRNQESEAGTRCTVSYLDSLSAVLFCLFPFTLLLSEHVVVQSIISPTSPAPFVLGLSSLTHCPLSTVHKPLPLVPRPWSLILRLKSFISSVTLHLIPHPCPPACRGPRQGLPQGPPGPLQRPVPPPRPARLPRPTPPLHHLPEPPVRRAVRVRGAVPAPPAGV